jgi:TonB family protein
MLRAPQGQLALVALVFAGCAGASAAGHSEPVAPDPTSLGTFDQQAVVRMIVERRAAIQACYENELATAATLTGRIAVQMTIEESGATEGVRVTDSSMAGGEAVAACVVRVVDEFEFDPGPTGGSVTYTFPFVFEPQN